MHLFKKKYDLSSKNTDFYKKSQYQVFHHILDKEKFIISNVLHFFSRINDILI